MKQINELENEVTSITLDDNLKKKVEERFVSIQQDSIKLNNICKNLIREIKEVMLKKIFNFLTISNIEIKYYR